MMHTLPADVARCPGHHQRDDFAAQRCATCQRFTAPQGERNVWMLPPYVTPQPCRFRIASEVQP